MPETHGELPLPVRIPPAGMTRLIDHRSGAESWDARVRHRGADEQELRAVHRASLERERNHRGSAVIRREDLERDGVRGAAGRLREPGHIEDAKEDVRGRGRAKG